MFKFIKSLFITPHHIAPVKEPDFDLEVGKLYQLNDGGVIVQIVKLEESNKIVHYCYYLTPNQQVVSHTYFKRLYKPL